MSLSQMMARMIFSDAAARIEARGYITVCEPAAGAGGLVLAAADVLRAQGYDPSRHMLVQAVDISHTAYHMCYVQLALKGVAGYVARANTLSMEFFEGAWTPAARIFQATHGHLSFERAGQGAAENDSDHAAEPVGVPVQLPLF